MNVLQVRNGIIIADDSTFEAPFATQYVIQQPGAAVARHPIDLVIGGHDRFDAGAANDLLEGWEEILAQSSKFADRRVRVIVLADEEPLKSAEECFRQGWHEAMTGQTIPLSELWEGIDAE